MKQFRVAAVERGEKLKHTVKHATAAAIVPTATRRLHCSVLLLSLPLLAPASLTWVGRDASLTQKARQKTKKPSTIG